jgi:hypothetical protein
MLALGEPHGQVKLVFPRQGVRLDFPQAIDEVELTVNNYAGQTLDFAVYTGDTLAKNFSEVVDNEVKQLNITQSGMTALEVSGGDNEAGIVEVCLCLPEIKEEPCEDICIDFEEFSGQKPLMESFTYQSITFIPLGDYGFRIVTWGKPDGRKKLVFPADGIRIELPHEVDKIELLVNNYYGTSLDFNVFAGEANVQQFTEQIVNEAKTVWIIQPGITAIEIKRGGNEAAVIEICLCLKV